MSQILCLYKRPVSAINQPVPLCPEANHTGIEPGTAQSGGIRLETHTQEKRPLPVAVNHQRPLKNQQKGMCASYVQINI